jgi:predicted TIM-barrel fold metal-dependent hydrolase
VTVRRIDACIHGGPPGMEALLPYLPEYWGQYLEETFLGGASSGTGRLHVTAGLPFTAPAWAQDLRIAPEDVRLEALRDHVLSVSDLAVAQWSAGAESYTHPYFGPALATAVNRWVADTYLEPEPRLLGTAALAPQHTAPAVEEVARIAHDRRFVQVGLPARAVEPYGAQRYWPIWEAAAEGGLALAITYGGASLTPPTPVNWPSSFFELYVTAPLQVATHLTSLVFSGIFERLPSLRVVVTESGWTWLPALMWKLDAEWRGARREVPWVREPPSDVLRRHVRLTTAPCDGPEDSRQLAEVVAQLESDEMLVHASDYPRGAGGGAGRVARVLEQPQAERLLWRNAWDTYGLGDRIAVASASGATRNGE